MTVTQTELDEMLRRDEHRPQPRLEHWPFAPPPQHYECDCAARRHL